MARTTLEMFIKIIGANKVAKALDDVSDELKDLKDNADKAEKKNKKFASSMSSLKKTAIAGGAIFAAKSLLDFSKSALDLSSSVSSTLRTNLPFIALAKRKLYKQVLAPPI